MSNDLHINSTGFNRLKGDSQDERTMEVEIADYDCSPALLMKASLRVRLVTSGEPHLEVIGDDGKVMGTVAFSQLK